MPEIRYPVKEIHKRLFTSRDQEKREYLLLSAMTSEGFPGERDKTPKVLHSLHNRSSADSGTDEPFNSEQSRTTQGENG
ncbi:MAG: hypothetical protein A3J50_02515 [Candidatus Woykebacteria bacterium RIFCSPHIGHO2_02_FULL_43_16b]|uniref:Uncharacterized protein n=1 Tax=Candidatus Woykebacteria bacterium RIFCSPHIGHO2_02_FULL_43_16b TaxID=1802601 RepID=A0A1G1WR18_9BACT|nr:MAG: hypothetical protein A3J50_02515 [Candidatus Woykebacteria bacterium RIFCSPHIGHO2_02_FULL_43_16b]